MSEQILDSVKSKYGAVPESTLSNDRGGFGYSAEEPTSIPAGLIRASPAAIPQLQPT
jgi:arsenite methyltransferase